MRILFATTEPSRAQRAHRGARRRDSANGRRAESRSRDQETLSGARSASGTRCARSGLIDRSFVENRCVRRPRVLALSRRHQASRTQRNSDLQTEAVRWARHRRRVDPLNAVERRVGEGPLSPAELENAKRWLDWATEELRGVDPIGELLRHSWPIAPLGAAAPMPWSWD